MSKKIHGIVLGILVLTLMAGTPPAYALLGSLKKKASSAKNTVTSTASSAKNTATSTASSAKNTATQTASNVAHSDKAQNAKQKVVRADQQAKGMVGQLSDVFSKVTD